MQEAATMATRPDKHPGGTRVHPPPSEAGQPASAGSAADAVQVVSISKSYGHRRHRVDALQDVTASFARGTLTAVMGLSGCGKSTLLQCAAGLDKPTAGTVRIGGTDLTRLSRRKLSVFRRERVGFVFQALNLVPTLSVAENIALPLRLDGRHVDHKRLREIAGQVGIADQLRRLPDTLSGGQRQRVAIARALITDPWVIFADEPTAALDPYISDAVLGLLRRAVDELHQTVVLVTHAPDVAAWADRVLLLDHGRLVGVRESPDPAGLAGDLRRLGAGEVAGHA
jgi:putative ABC transport system ATP-binding protein